MASFDISVLYSDVYGVTSEISVDSEDSDDLGGNLDRDNDSPGSEKEFTFRGCGAMVGKNVAHSADAALVTTDTVSREFDSHWRREIITTEESGNVRKYIRSQSLSTFQQVKYTAGEIRCIRDRLLLAHKSSRSGSLRNFTRMQKLTLTSLALVDFTSFCSMSIMAPFFPKEAAQKGMSDTISGLVFSFYALVMFISSPVFGKILPLTGAKFLFMTGMFVAGSCNFLFGWCHGTAALPQEPPLVKPNVLDSTRSLKKINLQVEQNLIVTKHFELDFATRSILKTIKGVSEKDLFLLKESMRTCIIDIIEKLRERSPLKYQLTRAISCLNPEVAKNRKVAEIRLSLCLEILVSNGRMSGSKADCVKLEFIEICKEEMTQDKIKSFNKRENSLDQFWIDIMKLVSKPCPNFRNFVQTILILSHGNTSVDRGFSVNSEIVVENLTERSLIAQRFIYDAIQDANGVENFNIDKNIIHRFRNAHSLYKEDMGKKEKETIKQREEQFLLKRKEAEIKELESKRAKMLSEASKISTEREKILRNKLFDFITFNFYYFLSLLSIK